MDIGRMEYIIAIAEENNITHAAQKLHLTQPALNQQLLKLEREFGLQLFVRSRTDWHPTAAGEVYLEAARKIQLIKKDCCLRLEEMADRQHNTLKVGFTPGRETRILTETYPRFHNMYPEYTVIPVEANVERQILLLKEGKLDLGFIAKSRNQALAVDSTVIAGEELMACVPAGCLENSDPGKELPLSLLRNENFALITAGTTLRTLIDQQFEKAGFSPKILFETSHNDTILRMIDSGICCGLIPSYYRRNAPQGVRWFSIEGKPAWEVDVIFRKGAYRTKAAKEFAALAALCWQKDK